MRRRAPLLFVAVLAPGLVGANNGGAPAAAVSVVADTVFRRALDLPVASVLSGLVADESEPHVRMGLRRIPIGPEGFGRARAGAFFDLGTRLTRWSSSVRGGESPLVLAPLVEEALRWRVAALGATGTSRFLPSSQAPLPALVEPIVESGRFVTEYADLAMQLRSRMELGGDWTRFQPCDQQFKVSCNPNLIPRLSPELLFGVQLEGTIADRIRVDVDFDQAREFDAANRINMFYEGGEDDILRRLEVGDVTFRLPESRFLTEGIPSGNFGFQAEGQFGPVDFQTVWAQQRGDLNSRVFQLSGLGDQRGFVQEDTLVLDDADYVRGQFFFLVDPQEIDRYPHVDALELDPASAPSFVAPGDQPIQLYRFEDEPVFQQQVEGFIQMDAEATVAGETVTESGWFRYLQPDIDYFVHPSGLWLALRAPLRSEEMLAVTYITAAGDTVGDYNPERIANLGGRPSLQLLKASGANHQPGRPTWDREMHQVYRVSGSPDVDPASVDLSISLGELSAGRTFKRRPSGEDITFLRLFGLDEEAPLDRVDRSFVYSPGAEVFQDQPPVQGTFIVFPTLQPFAEPPPVASVGLDETATAQILGDDANPRIYDEGDPFERDNAGRYRLTLAYRLQSEGLISSFSLGAFGIREASERVYLGDRLLTRGLDYEIDYDVGQVQLLDPDQLFATVPDASIRATWEQRSLFQVTPTQVFGLRTHTDLGGGGGVDVLGLYQSERSVVRRPILGTEPASALLGGVSTSYETGARWVDRLLDGVPGLRYDGQTSLSLDGELAMSLPNPNTRGRAFVDDFDASTQVPVSLLASEWILGSAPTARDGAEAVLPPSLDPTTAAPLVWQTSWIIEAPNGDSLGVHEGYFPRFDVDRQIRIAGSEVREPGLLLSLGGNQAGTGTSWRSVTTPLSTNGLDLTKTEFLEVYLSGPSTMAVVLDLGRVSEDALFIDASGNTTGTRAGVPWGSGVLDQEADPRRGEIWNDSRDQVGVWDESCVAERGRIYRKADPRAICTRGNGRPDTEDMDADGNLDVQERHLRYVIALDGTSPFLVRGRAETQTDFQLYRIPVRAQSATAVGGVVTESDLRAVRHLRLTVAGPPAGEVAVARMRLVGSRWIKRAGEGVLRGIVGDTLDAFGRVEVSTVSRVTEGEGYASPPGVLEELVDPTSAFTGQGIEFNEKSLGVSFTDIAPGGRAEVYQRFPQRPRNFLNYREARLWVVAKEGDFGLGRPHHFFLKGGSDPENFYLYRTPLRDPSGGGGVTPADWLPEVRIDFGEWFELRRRAEEELLVSPRVTGDPPVVLWSADSTYAVVLKDRGRAPNLAAVREVSMGVWNQGQAPLSGEVWIDELRLGDPVRSGGLAGSLDVSLDAAGVLTSRLSVTNRGGFFRQLRTEPAYQTDRTISLQSTLALDRWMPTDWGIEVPVTLDLDRSNQLPRFLLGSDVRADELAGLRATEARQTRVGMSFRKRTRSPNPWVGFVVDGLNARAAYTAARGSTVTSRNASEGVDAGMGWAREPASREVRIVPRFAEGVVRSLLPGFLEDKVVDARLRLTPERVSIGSAYSRQDARIFRFERIVITPEDTAAVATLIPRETVQTAADIRMHPLPPLIADLAFLSVRDLLSADEAVSDPRVRRLIEDERYRALGLPLGWETNRSLRTRLGFRPQILSWLTNDFDWSTVYRSDRSANLIDRSFVGADTTLALARNAHGQRDWGLTVAVDPRLLARSWFGEGPLEDSDVAQLRAMLSGIRPMTATYRDGITSRFNRDPVHPGLDYQFGWADMDGFRHIEGDTAATVTDRAAWTLSSGVTLPRGASIVTSFRHTDAKTLDTRSDRRIRQLDWPNVQVRAPQLTPPSFTGLRSVQLSSGIARSTREIEFGGRATQRRFDEDVRIPIDVSFAWVRDITTSYQGAHRSGRGEDPTGLTERDEWSHRISVRGRLLPPGALAARLDRPVQVVLLGGFTAERNCRVTVGRGECVAFLDQVRRTLSLTLDTSVGGFEIGMQATFDDRQSFVGQQTGSTQLQVGIFGQLDLALGALPGS